MQKKLFNSLQSKLVMLFATITTFAGIAVVIVISLLSRGLRNEAPPNFPPPQQITVDSTREQIDMEFRQRILEDRNNQQNKMLLLISLIVGLQILLTSLGSYLIVRNALKPLSILNETMRELNSLNLRSKIIMLESDSEIAQLIDNFNTMIVRIQQLIEKEKEFLDNISHELKTPLSAMRINLESMLIAGELGREQLDELTTAIDSIDEIDKLIEDLTLLSSLDKGKFELKDFDLVEAVEQVVKESEMIYKNRQLSIKLDNQISRFIIKGPKTLFKRAIANLIENSVKYSFENPSVEIVLKSPADRQLKVVITDRGKGIPREKLDKIFDRFYRVDPSRSKLVAGRGLGLSITKEIIEKMNGRIKLKSEEGKGTKAIIDFKF